MSFVGVKGRNSTQDHAFAKHTYAANERTRKVQTFEIFLYIHFMRASILSREKCRGSASERLRSGSIEFKNASDRWYFHLWRKPNKGKKRGFPTSLGNSLRFMAC